MTVLTLTPLSAGALSLTVLYAGSLDTLYPHAGLYPQARLYPTSSAGLAAKSAGTLTLNPV